MSAQMLQSFSGVMNGVGSAATPGMQQGMMRATNSYPNMPASMAVTPDMTSGATVAGVGANAPSSLTAGLDPMQIIAQSLVQQSSPKALAMQGLSQVGQTFIDKNVMPKQLAPPAQPFGMATSQMGPLQFGSAQSPLLAYLSMLGAR
jgi:hypothetical protein